MFTGIITDQGRITAIEPRGDTRLTVACGMDPAGIAIGASIACSGVCLTVIDRGGAAGDGWFKVDVSGETIACTAPSQWHEGRALNLEPALRLGDELGGHIVTGHVDAVGHIVGVCAEGDSLRLGVAAPASLAPYIAAKGSITLDGVSLTVNAVSDQADGTVHFAVNLIPHTAEVTTLGALKPGDAVNLEIDVLARYLKRMQALQAR
jgi:riboflavin synthase